MPMPAVHRPPRRRLTTARSLAATVVIALALLLLLVQCTSSASTDPTPARPTTPAVSVTAPAAPESSSAATSAPEPTGVETAGVDALAPPLPTPTPRSVPTRDDSSSGSVYYKNCSAARAAGVAPLHAGDPGYASHLDRDDDGVACE